MNKIELVNFGMLLLLNFQETSISIINTASIIITNLSTYHYYFLISVNYYYHRPIVVSTRFGIPASVSKKSISFGSVSC